MFSKITASWQERKDVTLLPIRGLVCTLVIGLIFYIILAVKAGGAEFKEYHFASERGAVTVLSAIFLSMACAFGAAAFTFDQRSLKSYRSFWLLAAAVFGFLALDELLEFHEKVGEWITDASLGAPSGFRNWNDVVVIGYGILGLLVLVAFLPEILRYPKFFEILCVAFVWFCIHTFIDSVSEPRTTVSAILEESAKLFCSAFLMLGMFVGMIGIERKNVS